MKWPFVVGKLLIQIFFSLWTTLGFTLLLDTGFTGASEWAPWAAQEAEKTFEFMLSYAVITVIGVLGTYRVIGWTRDKG